MSTDTKTPHLTRLASGYWRAEWSREIWAQWPVDRGVRRDDFFNPDWTYTPEREREIEAALAQTGERGR